MQVYGKKGYLGEFELSSIVSEQVTNGRKEYSGDACRLARRPEGNDRLN